MKFDHYTIRLIEQADLQNYFAMVANNRERLERFFAGTVSRTKDIDQTRVFLKEMEERIQNRSYFAYVIVDDRSSKLMGFLDLKNIEWSVPKSEIGFYIDKEYTGNGIVTKALIELCDYCFSQLGFEKLFLRTHHSNSAACKVAERCGFEVEGTLRSDYKTTSGELVDVLYYGKIR